jgi:hypothetical protein
VVALQDGEYFLDIEFELTAAYGDVRFVSDWVHYAWPFIRLNADFAVTKGARLLNSEGGVGQEQTNGKPARWVDYSNTLEGVSEGLALFSHPANPYPHNWLTRDYGTFGPRRVDAQSGKPFRLSKGESLRQRVGLLVHRGDAESGRVAERYQLYRQGQL